MKVKSVSRDDGYYSQRKYLVGAEIESHNLHASCKEGYLAGQVTFKVIPANPKFFVSRECYFYAIKIDTKESK